MDKGLVQIFRFPGAFHPQLNGAKQNYFHCMAWETSALADQGGGAGTRVPLSVQFLSFSCSFREKNFSNNRFSAPLWGSGPRGGGGGPVQVGLSFTSLNMSGWSLQMVRQTHTTKNITSATSLAGGNNVPTQIKGKKITGRKEGKLQWLRVSLMSPAIIKYMSRRKDQKRLKK